MNTALFTWINSGMRHPLLDALLPVFSDKDYVVVPGLVAVALLVYLGNRRIRVGVVALILALILSDFTCEKMLKPLFRAQRPYAALDEVHVHRSGEWWAYQREWYEKDTRKSYAFPSSHASNIAAAAVALFFLRRRTLWAMAPLALLVGWSRIYTGNHYPGDVLAGYAWGVLCAIGAVAGCDRTDRLLGGEEKAEERPSLCLERKVFYWVLGLWTFINFAFIHTTGLGLAGDEAQYWDWSRRLALGYYSKPPMIAYAIAGLVGAGGNKEWAIRSGAVLLSSGTLALIHALALRITNRERTALLAGLLPMAMPSTWVGAVIMTIDPLLLFFWGLAMYTFHRAVNGEPRMWWMTGIALGFGLLSKYTMVFLLLSFVLYLLLVDRSHWRTRGPYVALALCLLLFTGVLYWNWTHDWISFRHTANIGRQRDRSILAGLGRVAEFAGGQALLAGPIVFGFMLWGLARCARRFRANRDAAYLILCFAVIFLGYALISLSNRPQINWPVCAYLSAVPVLAWMWFEESRRPWVRILLFTGLVMGCFAGILLRSTDLLYGLDERFAPANAPEDRVWILGYWMDPDRDPTNRLQGGRELGAALGKYAPPGTPDGPFIFSDRYQLTATAAFYTKGRPRTYCMNPGDRRYNQYDLWGGWDELTGRDGLLVLGGDGIKAAFYIDELVRRGVFEQGKLLETVEVRRGDTLVKTYTISRMQRYSGNAWIPREERY